MEEEKKFETTFKVDCESLEEGLRLQKYFMSQINVISTTLSYDERGYTLLIKKGSR